MYHVALAKLSTAWLITICFGFISYNLVESMLIVFVYGGGKTWDVSGLSIASTMCTMWYHTICTIVTDTTLACQI